MKNKYVLRDGYAEVVIPYTGNKIPAKDYIMLVDLETLEILRELDRSIYLLIGSNNELYPMYKNEVNCYVHHLVLPKKDKLDVDHISRDTLDNRSSNLRYASRSENQRNTNKHKVSKHGYKWVAKNRNRYAANVRHNMKKIYLGNYDTPLEAHRVANRWVYENIGPEYCVRTPIKNEEIS